MTLAYSEGSEGHVENFNHAIDNALKTYDNAKSLGCGWAARVTPPPLRRDAAAATGPVPALARSPARAAFVGPRRTRWAGAPALTGAGSRLVARSADYQWWPASPANCRPPSA